MKIDRQVQLSLWIQRKHISKGSLEKCGPNIFSRSSRPVIIRCDLFHPLSSPHLLVLFVLLEYFSIFLCLYSAVSSNLTMFSSVGKCDHNETSLPRYTASCYCQGRTKVLSTWLKLRLKYKKISSVFFCKSTNKWKIWRVSSAKRSRVVSHKGLKQER